MAWGFFKSAALTSRASLPAGRPQVGRFASFEIDLVSEAAARSLGYATLASKFIALGSSDAPSYRERGRQGVAENSGPPPTDLNAP